jgi:hypothetical protein
MMTFSEARDLMSRFWLRYKPCRPKRGPMFSNFKNINGVCLPPVLRGENPTTVEVQQTEAEGSRDSTPGQEEHQDKKEQTGGPKQEAETSNPPSEPTSVVTPGKSSKLVDNPIVYVTPLQSTKGVPDAGWVFDKELTPITVEELPLNEFFFDKKRKVVVKQELYQEADIVSKKLKILTDGRAMKKEEFATQIIGTLGAFTITNQYSVGTLKDQLK